MSIHFNEGDLEHEDLHWLQVTMVVDRPDKGASVIASAKLDYWRTLYPFMTHVHVKPECRNQGMGRRLVASILEHCQQSDRAGLSLYVHEKNRGAIRFYERLGFTTVLREPDRDLLLMNRSCVIRPPMSVHAIDALAEAVSRDLFKDGLGTPAPRLVVASRESEALPIASPWSTQGMAGYARQVVRDRVKAILLKGTVTA